MSGSEPDWKDFLDRYGYYAATFELEGGARPTLPQLKEWMSGDSPRYTGWPPFWWPTRREIAPRVIDQESYECLHDGTGIVGHIERWRASTSGVFTIVRGHDSDREAEPGGFFELTLPVWRVSELLLYAGRMAGRFGAYAVDFTLRYEGLQGRVLSTRASPMRMLAGRYTTGASRYERRVALRSTDIDAGVVEMTDDLVRGLFGMFQFELPASLCEEEIEKMRASRM